jgi:hypothetical protein
VKLVLALLFAAGVGGTALVSNVATPDPSPATTARAEGGHAQHAARGRVAHASARSQYEFIPSEGRFVMARIEFPNRYRGGMRGWGGGSSCNGREPPWHHDFPSAEQNFTSILRELTLVHPYTRGGNVFTLDDPRLFMFPIAYMSEPGCWVPEEREVAALRNYLLKGGFMIFDDFGSNGPDDQLGNLATQLRRALPDHALVPIQPGDAVFDSFFLIDPPALRMPDYRGQIEFWGIYEDNDPKKRLMLIAGNNGDLGEFWEYVATGFYSVDLANEAYKVGVNYIVYALTH